MRRVLFLGFVLAATACGGKTFPSLCATQVPAPAACATPCDQSPGAVNSCPAGFHCSGEGKCDLACTATGGQCGTDYSCTSDGNCVPNGNGSGSDTPDACPSVHFTAMKTTPSVQLLIDRSGSMAHDFADKTPTGPADPAKYPTVHDALTGTTGAVTQLDQQVYFGASLFSDDAPCPKLYSVPRVLGNKNAIDTLIGSQAPGGNTPTPPSIDAVVADFMANPAPKGSPPIILLATDGLPNKCGDGNTSTQTESVAAAANAFAKGIRLFVLSVGDTAGTAAHFQALANAGQGVQTGQPNATYYPATDPTSLAAAFKTIIGGVLSCDLQLSGQVDPTAGQNGTVTLNNVTLNYGTDWTLDPNGLIIHLVGTACTTLKTSQNPTVDATFACGAVIF
jgi:hypothetical protein